MKKRFLILAAVFMSLLPATASAARVHFFVGGPAFYGGGFYNPYWAGYWGPYYAPYGYYPNVGEVKLDTKMKDAQVFIDGAYAGTTHENKTMHLRPGNYNIEIRDNGETLLSQRVYVVAGKTLHLKFGA